MAVQWVEFLTPLFGHEMATRQRALQNSQHPPDSRKVISQKYWDRRYFFLSTPFSPHLGLYSVKQKISNCT